MFLHGSRKDSSLKGHAAQRQVALEILPTTGSADALQQLLAGEIDLALIQGGLRNADFEQVRQVAALHLEPLHLAVGPEFWHADPEKCLSALSGKVVNLSSHGSGTRLLAAEIMSFSGLVAGRDFISTNYTYSGLMTEWNSLAPQPSATGGESQRISGSHKAYLRFNL